MAEVRRRWRRPVRSSLGMLASVALLAGMAVVASPAAAQDPAAQDPAEPATAVQRQVWNELAEADSTTVWVYLRESADLTPAATIADRASQGRFVHAALTATAARTQAGLQRWLASRGVSHESYWIANVVRVDGADAGLVEALAARPEVSQIAADREVPLVEPVSETDADNQVTGVEWNIDEINAPDVWERFDVTGEDIVVGTIDTGAQFDHPALVHRYRGNQGFGHFDHNYSWHDPSHICGNPSLVPCDNVNHGTHVLGTILGDDGGDNRIGVAPGATWIAAKGCENRGCSVSALLSAGQFMLAPTDLNGQNADSSLRPHVLNNSWGGLPDTDPWYRPTVQAWVSAGIFPVFANGNDGPGCANTNNPGNLPESYSAGAYTSSGNVSFFSSRGPSAWGEEIVKPDIAAPGSGVRSSVPGDGYLAMSGTSMAAPHVVGAVALIWSASRELLRDIEGTRAVLDTSARDTPDDQCGGTPENNNVYGEGKLDTFAAVDAAPKGPTGVVSGTVVDAASGEPIRFATVTIAGEVVRERVTGADGSYRARVPVGAYDLTASAFGYADQAVQVSIVEGQEAVRNLEVTELEKVTISGTVTDGSGHGWPLYAHVGIPGSPAETYTDPVTGAYRLEVPVDGSYNVEFSAQADGYADLVRTIDVGGSDRIVDTAVEVHDCDVAPGYDFSGTVGIVEDLDGQLSTFLASHGIPSSIVHWGGRFGEADFDVADFDVLVVHRQTDSRDEFADFLADADAAGTGVVFTDNWGSTGIRMLWQYTGVPSTRRTGLDATISHLFYEVTQEHPILDGFAVGEQIRFEDSTEFKTHAWFDGYQGAGRQVIASAGRGDTGMVGAGIGVQQRANNRHVLLSLHGLEAWISPGHWSDDAGDIFVNSLAWAASDATFGCVVLDGGLVVGNVTEANEARGVNGATVTSAGNPAVSATTVATPDDPNLDDGFYSLFSPSTGSQEFHASAARFQNDTQTVDLRPDATNQANFVLGAGHLLVEPEAVETNIDLGDSKPRRFTIANDGTVPVEMELAEDGGDVPWLSVDPLAATLQPGESWTVTVTLDGAVDQPGTFTGDVQINHDTPYQVPPVPVTMQVNPPPYWGKVSGSVTGTDCQGSTMPLAGAEVQIDGERSDATLRTDAEGQYAYWMPVWNNPADLTVAADGFVSETRTTAVRPGRDVVADFNLQSIGIC